jgi:subtilase-type serine protease
MKPKYSQLFRKTLPLLIVLPAMLQQLHAATITPGPTGDVVVPSGNTPTNSTVLASGGTSPTPTVTIASGAVLTGDPVLQDAIQVSAANYRIINSGSLSGQVQGIDSNGQSIIVTNSGSITGTTLEGIRALGGSTSITNNSTGSIIGSDDGVYFSTSGGTVINNGTIRGLTGLNSDGVDAASTLTLTNAGTIAGNRHGILALADSVITNNNNGTIQGLTGNGITAGNNATIVNNSGGTISSANALTGEDAIQINFGTITNNGSLVSGTLVGDSGIQINGGGASQITNTGTITGFQGINILGTADDLVTNTGTITSTNGPAISLGAGTDVININDGSIINGAIDGGLGLDTLNFNGGATSSSDSTRNEVHGNVAMETITMNGTGSAFLGTFGNQSYGANTDAINLNSGSLTLNANVSELTLGGNPTIITTQANTLLGGTESWIANVTLNQAGIGAGQTPSNLSANPAATIGTLTISGDVTQVGSGNWINYDVRPQSVTPVSGASAADIINHNGGTYDLGTASQIRIAPTDVNFAMSDGSYTVINSTSAIIGNLPVATLQFQGGADNGFVGTLTGGSNVMNSVLVNEFTTVSRINGDSDLIFTIDHDYAGLSGLTRNQSSLGAAIDASVGSTNILVQDFIAALDFSDLATVQATLASLDPSNTMALASMAMNSNYRLHRIAQEHLAVVRSGEETRTYTAADTRDAKGGMVAGQTTTSSSSSRGNFWGSVSYDSQDYEVSGNSADYDGNAGALTAGFDWRLAPDFVLGVMLDGSRGSYDGQGGDDSDVDSYRGAIYGTYGKSLGLYSDMLVGYGAHDFDNSRTLGGILSGDGSSDTDADSLQALLTVGYAMGDQRIKHGPYAGLEYQKLNVDGFDQAGLIPISVNDYDIESLRGLVGYRVSANLGTFRPYASATYAHEFEDGENGATSTFAGTPFTTRGAEQSSAILVTAGTGIALTDSLLLDLGYRGDIATDDGLTSHGATIGLNYSF